MKLLSIQSSVRKQGSISRSLSADFLSAIKSRMTVPVVQRDVGINPPAHPTELWTAANYTPPEERTDAMCSALAESERLIEELLNADHLLMGVPMYNFSVPSTLKAYLDNVIRINRTFTFDREAYTFQGLATGKKALIITPSAGNFVEGTAMGSMNFCDPYLRSVLGFIGIEDVIVVPVPDQFMSDEVSGRSLETARAQLMEIAAAW